MNGVFVGFALAFAIFMFSGFLYSIIREEFPEFPLKPLVVSACYALGFLGSYTFYRSPKAKTKQLRWGLLIIGFLAVAIAWCSLETLYKSGM